MQSRFFLSSDYITKKRCLRDQMVDAELSFQNIFEKLEFFFFNVSLE